MSCLSQGQWTAGLTAIAAEIPNVAVQKNMLAYLASLLQDVCDYGFPVGHGLVLSFIIGWTCLLFRKSVKVILTGLTPSVLTTL